MPDIYGICSLFLEIRDSAMPTALVYPAFTAFSQAMMKVNARYTGFGVELYELWCQLGYTRLVLDCKRFGSRAIRTLVPGPKSFCTKKTLRLLYEI